MFQNALPESTLFGVIRSGTYNQKPIKLIAMAKKKNDRADQDSPWKRILRFNFREAIEFLFPAIAAEIDWTKPIEFLEKEFQQLTPDSEIGKRLADQLVRAYKKGGGSIILLIHLEVVRRESCAYGAYAQ
jgi:hypothetical protein